MVKLVVQLNVSIGATFHKKSPFKVCFSQKTLENGQILL